MNKTEESNVADTVARFAAVNQEGKNKVTALRNALVYAEIVRDKLGRAMDRLERHTESKSPLSVEYLAGVEDIETIRVQYVAVVGRVDALKGALKAMGFAA